MYLSTDTESLRVYEALASEVRLQIIDLLYTKEMHIKELASVLYLSSAIVSKHVSQLQKAGLVSYRMRRVNGGTYKYCSLSTEYLQIRLSKKELAARKFAEVSVPVGHYTDIEASPTCGIATTEKMIGHYDNPTYFLDPERVHAGILWFARGFVEYKIPNFLFKDQTVQEIEISMEIGSEAPHVDENWPSDIQFTINGRLLGVWTSPGDFGNRRGRLSPAWWHNDVNQYGLMKVLRINEHGTYIDGMQISEMTIRDVPWDSNQWTFRISAEDVSRGRGGLTLYGKGFGNYDQDIVIRSYYK
jgi:predicted transcriptional regulator